jgi:hypothetical protein
METTKKIEQYLDGSLDIAERKMLEKQALQDERLKNLINLHREVNDSIKDRDFYVFSDTVKSVGEEFFAGNESFAEKEAPPYRKISLNWIYRIAAAFVFLLLAGILIKVSIYNSASSENLYQKYHNTYTTDRVMRSGQTNEMPVEKALRLYNEGSYTEALAAFQTIAGSENPDYMSVFFSGLSYLELNRSGEAITAFKSIPADWNSPLKEHRDWYLALALLRNGNNTEAAATLQQIQANQGYYAEKAIKILRKIN